MRRLLLMCLPSVVVFAFVAWLVIPSARSDSLPPRVTAATRSTVCPIDLNFASVPNQNLSSAGTYTLSGYSVTVTAGTSISAAYVDAGSLVFVHNPAVGSPLVNCNATVPPTQNWMGTIDMSTAAPGWSPIDSYSRIEVVARCQWNGAVGYAIVGLDSNNTSGQLKSFMGTGVQAVSDGNVNPVAGQCVNGSGSTASPSGREAGQAAAYSTMMPAGFTSVVAAGVAVDSYAGTLDPAFWRSHAEQSYWLVGGSAQYPNNPHEQPDAWKLRIMSSGSGSVNESNCSIQRIRFCYRPIWDN